MTCWDDVATCFTWRRAVVRAADATTTTGQVACCRHARAVGPATAEQTGQSAGEEDLAQPVGIGRTEHVRKPRPRAWIAGRAPKTRINRIQITLPPV